MRSALRLSLLLGALLGSLTEAGADVVYPARLFLTEVAPGHYDVAFTLPVLEGRRLRAEPELPETCRDVSERVASASSSSYDLTWTIACEPASLAGEVIFVGGLLGTQTELRVEIATLDGRLNTALLRPSRPGLVVPSPPTTAELALGSALAGMRRVLRFPELWLLVLVLAFVFSASSLRPAAMGILGFAAGHVVAQWLAACNGLVVSAHLGPAFALASGLVPALALAKGKVPAKAGELWLTGIVLGAVFGGVRPDPSTTEGLSRSEQVAAALFFGVGVAMGLALLAAVGTELRRVTTFGDAARWRLRFGYVAGIIAVGLLVLRLVAIFLLPTELHRAPYELALFAVVLGTVLPARGVGFERGATLAFGLALGAGLAAGLLAFEPSFGRLVALGSLFLFGALLFLARPMDPRSILPLSVLGVFGHGFQTGGALDQNATLPVATAAGAGLVALCLFRAGLLVSRSLARDPWRTVARGLGASVALLALAWRLGDYLRWLDGPLASEAALGLVRVPLLALALLLLAVLVRPRRRRVLSELGIERRTTHSHWALVGLAFFLLPVGTLAARNPTFEAQAPDGEDARRIVSQVLWNTYNAFNLSDEAALYDRLSENVTGDLVEDLYLDGRRRLTAGTREGAEVTVRDVSVVAIDDAAPGSGLASGFVYECQWIVTARVRHLQHVHHRQNIYKGKLLIRVDGDRWKIANVELSSEDRVVLPWNPTTGTSADPA